MKDRVKIISSNSIINVFFNTPSPYFNGYIQAKSPFLNRNSKTLLFI